MLKISPIKAQAMLKLCPRYSQDTPRYAQDICPRNGQYMSQIYLRYVPDMPQICPGYVPDMCQIGPRYSQDIPGVINHLSAVIKNLIICSSLEKDGMIWTWQTVWRQPTKQATNHLNTEPLQIHLDWKELGNLEFDNCYMKTQRLVWSCMKVGLPLSDQIAW